MGPVVGGAGFTSPGRVVAFGEPLLRLSAPGSEILLQTPSLDVFVGGAEANVAVSLARLGHQAAMVGVVPENGLGRAFRDELRRHGVETDQLVFRPGRMGLYFYTSGAIRRPSEVLYDRANSAFAAAPADTINWEAVLANAAWLHLSGITAAVGPAAAAAALAAVRSASLLNCTVSFDCNYRAKLWEAWRGDGPATLRGLLAHIDVFFGDFRDIGLILGRQFEGNHEEMRAQAASDLFDAFPNIQIIACTHRAQASVDHHDISGYLFSRLGWWTAPAVELFPVIDRIGGGDAFAAGVIHGLRRGWEGQRTLDFALAAAALKHSIRGDLNLVAEEDILAAMSSTAMDVRR